ncbi:MAG: hypothetical protein ACXQS2_00725, partial [Methermicoccaceae archaeon]
ANELGDILEQMGEDVRYVTWVELDDIARREMPCILVIRQPLLSGNGTYVYDVMPSIISDRNKNGYIRDDSNRKKSYLYDWMSGGMVLITPESTQPNWRILYDDGNVSETKDKKAWNDASTMLTDSTKAVQFGRGSAGAPQPKLNIEKTLGLGTWLGKWGFDSEGLDSEGLSYYPYGHFRMVLEGSTHDTYLPAFIRVGQGGWLAISDITLSEEKKENGRELDIAKMIMHEPWNTWWLQNGWVYDSAKVSYPVLGGAVNTTESISVVVPTSISRSQKSYVMRLYLMAYDADDRTYHLIRKMAEVNI